MKFWEINGDNGEIDMEKLARFIFFRDMLNDDSGEDEGDSDNE